MFGKLKHHILNYDICVRFCHDTKPTWHLQLYTTVLMTPLLSSMLNSFLSKSVKQIQAMIPYVHCLVISSHLHTCIHNKQRVHYKRPIAFPSTWSHDIYSIYCQYINLNVGRNVIDLVLVAFSKWLYFK